MFSNFDLILQKPHHLQPHLPSRPVPSISQSTHHGQPWRLARVHFRVRFPFFLPRPVVNLRHIHLTQLPGHPLGANSQTFLARFRDDCRNSNRVLVEIIRLGKRCRKHNDLKNPQLRLRFTCMCVGRRDRAKSAWQGQRAEFLF